MKYYLTYCGFCSDERYPDERWFSEDNGVLTCLNCKTKLEWVQCDGFPRYHYLKVINHGNE